MSRAAALFRQGLDTQTLSELDRALALDSEWSPVLRQQA
jgi:hypothetical protein